MSSINKVILVGNLGKDPDIKKLNSGESVVNVAIATSESYKDKSGVRQEKTEWHNLVLYRRLAEIAGQYLKKGSKIYIEGKLQTRKWQDKDGRDRYTTEIIVAELQMLGSGSEVKSQTAQTKSTPSEFDIPFDHQVSTKSSSVWDSNMNDDYPF